MSRDTDRQIQATSFHFQQREHLRTSSHMSKDTDRRIKATSFHFQQREHLKGFTCICIQFKYFKVKSCFVTRVNLKIHSFYCNSGKFNTAFKVDYSSCVSTFYVKIQIFVLLNE
jgi:hypothetical protein